MARTPAPLLGLVGALPILTVALSAALVGCDEPADQPPIVFRPPDSGLPDDGGPRPDAEPPPDSEPPPDRGPPPDIGPACVNPCDDGDPGTTADRCIDDACAGDPLPALLALVGDAPLAGAPGRPTAPLHRIALDGGALRAEPTGFDAPRGRFTAPWLTRPLADLARTVILQAGPGGFTEVAQAPLVADAAALSGAGGSLVLVGPDSPVVHLDADGAATALGPGLADATAFLGVDGDQLVGRALGAVPGAPWIVGPAASLDGGQMLGGLGLVPADGGLLVVDPIGERQTTVELSGPLRAGDGWLAQASGDGFLRVASWPPTVHRSPMSWTDIAPIDGGALAIDAEGNVWWIALADAPAAPVELGTLPPDATLLAARPDGALARNTDGLWWLTADADPSPLPAAAGDFAGFIGDAALFADATHVEAIDVRTGTGDAVEGAFGAPLGIVDDALWIRDAAATPMRLVRLDADGSTPLSTVWSPEARTLVDTTEWVRTGGDTAAFIAEEGGPLLALDLADPTAEPVPAARLRIGTRWAIGGVSADGRWVVWRAGDAVVGSLRGARVDGSHFPDGVELLRSRAYPVLMAPEGARLAVAVDPLPSGGFPIIDLDRESPDEATWVVSEGTGLFPIAWLDGDSLLVGLCVGQMACDGLGLGRVDLLDGTPFFAPLIGGDPALRFPVWGETVQAVGGQLYYVRNSGLGQYEVRRIPLDGRGGWSTVAIGPAPTRLHGPSEWGIALELGGVLHHAQLTGDPIALDLPGARAGLGPLRYEAPLTALAESGDARWPCADCVPWRLDRDGGPPTALADTLLRPVAWSPANDVLVHQRIVGGRLGLALTDDTPGPVLDRPTPADGDVRVLRWLAD